MHAKRVRLLILVSIHAPTRGATDERRRNRRGEVVSIHAPTRGATGRAPTTISPYSCFNPRAHEGRDIMHHRNPGLKISFNPRAHEGRDA